MTFYIETKSVSKEYVSSIVDFISLLKRADKPKDNIARKLAVKNISLRIDEGERVGFIGRNGAGKSTLLHMLAGISDKSSGEISIEGSVTSILTLGHGLRDELSGRENIYIDGEVLGKSREEVSVYIEEIIEFADIGEFIDYPVKTYSTGMQARLAFSMIVKSDPEILIIDEALSVGDADFSRKANKIIRKLTSKGKIVILVSHSMETIKDYCNRCIWMDDGEIVEDGKPEDVISSYMKSVTKQNEVELRQKFESRTSQTSCSDKYQITDLDIFQDDSDIPKVLLESGRKTNLIIKISTSNELISLKIRIDYRRADGVLVSCSTILVDVENTKSVDKNNFSCEIFYDPLILGPSLYEIEISLEIDSEVVSSFSKFIEVISHSMPRGGVPMLLYTGSILSNKL